MPTSTSDEHRKLPPASRMRGALLGVLIGDSLALDPTGKALGVDSDGREEDGAERFEHRFGSSELEGFSETGKQFLLLLELLSGRGTLSRIHYTHTLWRRQQKAHAARSPGASAPLGEPGTLEEFERALDFEPPAGVLVRALSLFVWMRGADERVLEAAMKQAPRSDPPELAGLACGFACVYARALFLSRDPDQAWDEATHSVAAFAARRGIPPRLVATIATRSESAHASLASVLADSHRAVAATSSFREALDAALGSETCPASAAALAGAFAGIRYGEAGIPESLREALLRRDHIESLADSVGRHARRNFNLNRRPLITSETHPLPIAELPVGAGVLAVSARPGQCRTWMDGRQIERDLALDLDRLREWRADHIVAVLDHDSICDSDHGDLADEVRTRGLEFTLLPEPQGGEDSNFEESLWAPLKQTITGQLRRGQRVVMFGNHWLGPVHSLAAEVLVAAGAVSDRGLAAETVISRMESAELGAGLDD